MVPRDEAGNLRDRPLFDQVFANFSQDMGINPLIRWAGIRYFLFDDSCRRDNVGAQNAPDAAICYLMTFKPGCDALYYIYLVVCSGSVGMGSAERLIPK